MTQDVERVQQLLEMTLSDDDLFTEIGDVLLDKVGFTGNDSVDKLLETGKGWWSEKGAEVKGIVCKIACNDNFASATAKDTIQIILSALGIKFGGALAIYVTTIAIRKVSENWCSRPDP